MPRFYLHSTIPVPSPFSSITSPGLFSGFTCALPCLYSVYVCIIRTGLFPGFTYALPYLYPVYLAALLVPRCIQDEKSCRQRYGDKDWDKYTSIVKYRLIPYIF